MIEYINSSKTAKGFENSNACVVQLRFVDVTKMSGCGFAIVCNCSI